MSVLGILYVTSKRCCYGLRQLLSGFECNENNDFATCVCRALEVSPICCILFNNIPVLHKEHHICKKLEEKLLNNCENWYYSYPFLGYSYGAVLDTGVISSSIYCPYKYF
jgi:hypothetical protein